MMMMMMMMMMTLSVLISSRRETQGEMVTGTTHRLEREMVDLKSLNCLLLDWH